MQEAVIVSATRTAVGKAPNGALQNRAARRDGCRGDRRGAASRARIEARRGRRCDGGVRDAGGRAGAERRAHRQPSRRRSGRCRGRHDESVLRVRAAGDRIAAEHVMCGFADIVIAGGTESMSLVPMGGNKVCPNPTLVEEYPDVYLSTGLVAENHARENSISREEQDRVRAAQPSARTGGDRCGPIRRRDHAAHVRGRLSRIERSAGDSRGDIRAGRRSAAGHVDGGARQAAAGISRDRHRDRRQLIADERRRSGRDRDVGRRLHASAASSRLRVSCRSPPPASSRNASASARFRQCGRRSSRRADARSDRSRRAERGIRGAGARLSFASCRSIPIGSTSTAAQSRSDIRSAAPARS